MSNQTTAEIEQRIATDQMEYLRKHSDVCAKGSVTGLIWIRYCDGEWQAVAYGGQHRLQRRVRGVLLEEDNALSWLINNPVSILPVAKAGAGIHSDSVWSNAEDQDVFRNANRCFWCGKSEHVVSLTESQTTEQGACSFCPDCLESWQRAGEIADPQST